MRFISPLRWLALLALSARLLSAADSPPALRPITAEDLWSVKRPAALALSPDGTRLVFTVQEFNLEKNSSVTHLWLLDTASGAARQITTGDSTDAAPAWSPDSQTIAYTSKHGTEGNAALQLLRVDDGEPVKILELPLPMANPHWLPDGESIVIATRVLPKFGLDFEAMKKELKRQKDSKVTARVTENRLYRQLDAWQTDEQASRLLRIDLSTKKVTDLTPRWTCRFRQDGETQFDVSPDGHWIALSAGTTPPPYATDLNYDVYLLSVDHPESAWKNLTADNRGPDNNPLFSPDSRSVLFGRKTSRRNALAEYPKLMRADIATGKVERLLADADLPFEDWHYSLDGRTIYFRAEDHGRTAVFKASAEGNALAALDRTGTTSALAAGTQRLFYLRQGFSRPDEVVGLELANGRTTVLTHLNDELFAQLKLGKVEEYTFAGADGDTVEGWLIYPPDFDPAKKYPLLQVMHGGPQTMVGDMWQPRWNAQVFVAPGYVATWVNRHGSTGFGEKYAASIEGGWGEKPYQDIMLATDYLLKKHPFLDGGRMIAMGGSYGGYMAAWICGHTERFKAIICHAGVSDFDVQWASDSAILWQDSAMDGSPWRRTAAYDAQNPMTYAKNFKTPTLVIHGEMDYRVPVAQGLEFYAALQAQQVPSRLVYFPDESHWVLHPQNSVFWYGEVRSWIARWLK